MASTLKPRASANTILGAFALVSLFGMVGLALTALVGFEHPNTALLVWSSILALAAPAAILVHLNVTRDLTRAEQRIWIRELLSARAPWAWSEYLMTDDRRATAERYAEDARVRRASRCTRTSRS